VNEVNTAGETPALMPPFVPFLDGTPPAMPEWATRFLVALARFGGQAAAAATAGVPLRTARMLRETSAAFDEECEAALEYRADKLAHELPGSSRPVGSIVELKRHRPLQYIEKNVTLNLNAEANSPPPPGMADFLEKTRAYLLEQVPPAIRARLEADDADFSVVFAAYLQEGRSIEAALMRGDVIDMDDATGIMTARDPVTSGIRSKSSIPGPPA
jgi:hypothetical protein